jgi:ubiquinone/menaquinone biosynthesis C-methylase UbiE
MTAPVPPVRHRWFAAFYDRLDRLDEKRMTTYRRRVAGGAGGRVLEAGGGTGANLPYYDWAKVDSLDLTEPDPHMLSRAEPKRAALTEEARAKVRFHQSPAEELPFADASFDCAVVTLVLCSVHDLDRAIAELRRVLKPGGQVRLLEHVAAEGALGRFQQVFQPVQGWLAGGCQLRRHTEDALRQAGFSLDVAERLKLTPYAPAFIGIATKG